MNRLHGALAVTAATLAAGAALVDRRVPLDVTHLATEIAAGEDHISALELGEQIMKANGNLKVFDLRTPAEFAEFHIPGARQISIEQLAKEPVAHDTTIALYSEGGAHAAQAWVLMRLRGYRKVVVLREGIYEWSSRVLEPRLATDATPQERAEFTRASVLSRYFGGMPRSGVARSEVPVGYWTAGSQQRPDSRLTRYRGC